MRRFAEFRPRKSEEGKREIGTWGNHNQSIAIMAVTTDINAHVRWKQGGNHNQSIAIMAVTTTIIAQVHIEMRNLVVTQIIAQQPILRQNRMAVDHRNSGLAWGLHE